jgi:hypothetical protein
MVRGCSSLPLFKALKAMAHKVYTGKSPRIRGFRGLGEGTFFLAILYILALGIQALDRF